MWCCAQYPQYPMFQLRLNMLSEIREGMNEYDAAFVHIVKAKLGQASACAPGNDEVKLMTKHGSATQ